MKFVKDRQSLLLLAALLAFGLLVSDKLIFSPLARVWKQRSARIASLEKSINNGALLLERAGSIEERWKMMKEGALPANSSEAESQVFQSVERWKQASRISFTGFTPQRRRASEDHTALEYRADGFGDLQAISQFIYGLERDPLPLRVEDLQITSRDDLGQQLTIQVRFSGLLLEDNSR